jgi:hypothetical protein
MKMPIRLHPYLNKIKTIIVMKGRIRMSRDKKEKVVHVDKLTVYAKDVDIIDDRREDDFSGRRDPWGFFWGRPRISRENEQEADTREEHGE